MKQFLTEEKIGGYDVQYWLYTGSHQSIGTIISNGEKANLRLTTINDFSEFMGIAEHTRKELRS